MVKVFPSVNFRSWALPLGGAYRRYADGSFIVLIQLLCVALNFAVMPEAESSYVDPYAMAMENKRRQAAMRRLDIRMTKKYADERQKAPRNRKRKPSKAMQHIYQLG